MPRVELSSYCVLNCRNLLPAPFLTCLALCGHALDVAATPAAERLRRVQRIYQRRCNRTVCVAQLRPAAFTLEAPIGAAELPTDRETGPLSGAEPALGHTRRIRVNGGMVANIMVQMRTPPNTLS